MDLCVMIEGQEDVSWDEWRALAAGCEANGIPALFRSDHYLALGEGADGRQVLDAWGTVCALAAITSTVRLGTMVSPATFRRPSVLARMVATADHISGGRIELGLGAGWNVREHEAYGFRFPDVGERMEILEEQMEIIHRQWTEEEFSFEGRHYRLELCRAEPKPRQQPHPPLILGGAAGPRAARLAAHWADEYNTTFATPEQCRERRARIVEACEQAGREPITFSLMTVCVVGSDPREVLDRARRRIELTGRDDDPIVLLSQEDKLVGTVDELVARLKEYERSGVERVFLQHLDHADLEMVGLIGEELVPALA
jgi:F420-dependent oxidoreductase-like protein